jgi:hypothetical protein
MDYWHSACLPRCLSAVRAQAGLPAVPAQAGGAGTAIRIPHSAIRILKG